MQVSSKDKRQKKEKNRENGLLTGSCDFLRRCEFGIWDLGFGIWKKG
jgi:hypothetical protein